MFESDCVFGMAVWRRSTALAAARRQVLRW